MVDGDARLTEPAAESLSWRARVSFPQAHAAGNRRIPWA